MAAKGKTRSRLAALNIRLDRNSRTPLWRQVEKAILRKVASEEFLAGDRLPGMRAMAAELGVSMDTVKKVLAELADAGVVVSHPRSGVAIARADEAAKPGASRRTEPAALLRPLNGRATHAASVFGGWTPKIAEGRLFMPYVPAMNAVLDQEWLRISSVVARAPWHNSFYGHPAGLPLLRKAIAENFRLKFGTEVDPDNVVVTSGTVQALALCACLLFEQGDSLWVEAPSSRTFAEVLPFWGIKANPMPVDDDGANIAFAAAAFPQARGAFVTSASQMPIGVPLSQSRREALVAWALATRSYIIEDATGSDISLDGRNHPPIATLPGAERCTICILSFSMKFFPDLKIACMIVPPQLAAAFSGGKLMFDRNTSARSQEIMARFFASDAWASYERRVVRRFRAGFRTLRDAAAEALSDFGRITNTCCGGHTALLLKPALKDTDVSRRLDELGISALPISRYWGAEESHNGLLLGFGSFAEEEIRRGIDAIAQACSSAADNALAQVQ